MTYRHSNYETCIYCGERAMLRCPRCGRAFCSDHGLFNGNARCGDCEAHYMSAQGTRDVVSALAGVGSGVGAAAVFLGAGAVSLVWIPFTVLIGALGGALVGGPWAWWNRRKFLKQGTGERVITGALTINPHGGDNSTGSRRSVAGWQHRDRGNLPSVPIYQRTYGH